MDFFLEERRNVILIRQKWKYNWLTLSGTSQWNYQEKKAFHQKADQIIWQEWGGHFKMRVSGKSDFAKQHANTIFTLNFDILWELTNPHWVVNVTKIPKNKFKRSNVIWGKNETNLDTEDVNVNNRIRAGKTYKQYPVSHEYGHSSGNVPQNVNHWDEYRSVSNYVSDKKSMMNIGHDLRERHIDYIMTQLNLLIPNTSFTYAVKP